MMPPRRIAIIGCSGAGKSTLARRLAPITHLPLIHLDAEFWQPGWIETPTPQWIAKVRGLIAAKQWIMDGNFGSTQEMIARAADVVVWLDFNRWRCMFNVAKRVIRSAGRVRPDMAQGCPEKWDWDFMEWIWNFPTDTRPKIINRMRAAGAEGKVIRLVSPLQADEYVLNMELLCRSTKQ